MTTINNNIQKCGVCQAKATHFLIYDNVVLFQKPEMVMISRCSMCSRAYVPVYREYKEAVWLNRDEIESYLILES